MRRLAIIPIPALIVFGYGFLRLLTPYRPFGDLGPGWDAFLRLEPRKFVEREAKVVERCETQMKDFDMRFIRVS